MIYKQFEQSDIVAGRSTKVSTGIFSNGQVSQTQNNFASGSLQATISGSNRFDVYNGYYYLDVYPSIAATSSSNDSIFSISYGNVNGYGTSYDEYTNIKASPTKAIWSQYVNALNAGENFSVKSQASPGSSISNVTLSTDFIALSFNSQKIRDGIDAGQFQMTVENDQTNYSFNLIDDSSITGQSGSAGYYNLILGNYDASTGQVNYNNYTSYPSGSLYSAVPAYTGDKSVAQYHPNTGIGLLFPKTGVVILNLNFLLYVNHAGAGSLPRTLPVIPIPDTGVTSPRVAAPDPVTNVKNYQFKESIYNMIRASTVGMRLRRSEYVPSRHYFIRVKNRDFNYTNNPTFTYSTSTTDAVTGETHQRGDIKQTEFLTDPKVYPTSVGLYNSNNELVAVAKLSRPAQKTFSNELLIKVRLDF
jgi:hypothetical protein